MQHVEGWHFDVRLHFNSAPDLGKEVNFTLNVRKEHEPEKWEKLQKEAKGWLAELLSLPCEIEHLRVYKVGDHFKVKEGGH